MQVPEDALTTAPAPGEELSTAQTHQPAASESLPGAPGAPTGSFVAPVRLSPVVLDAVAMLAAELVPAESIAAGTGLKLSRVKSLLRGDNQQFNSLLEGYREQRLRGSTGHLFKLYRFREDAYKAIEEGLHASDIKVRVETAKWYFSEVHPKPTTSGEAPADINIKVSAAAVEQMTKADVEWRAFLEARSGNGADLEARMRRHIKVGTDALPTPPAQLEVELGPAGDPSEAPKDEAFVEVLGSPEDE